MVPSVLIAMEWLPPPPSLDQVVKLPSCTGLDLGIVELSPTLPLSFLPQAHSVPSALMLVR